MRLVLAAKSTADRGNLSPSAERLVNCYAYPAPEGARAPLVLRATPGTREWVTLPGPFLRALTRVEGVLYALAFNQLIRINEDGTHSVLATIPDDPAATFVGHRDKITLASNGVYYVWDGSTLTQPDGGRLTSVGSVAFLDQFTLMGERDGREVEWTSVGIPTTRNALYFATAEARDDKIVRISETGAYLAVLKQHSLEIWGNTGAGGSSAFVRVGDMVMDRGLRNFNLMTKTPDGVFFVGEDDIAYMLMGAELRAVSPPNVAQAIKSGSPTHCFYYEDRGHQFCVIRFSDRPAWVYDMTMSFWHERSSGTEHGPWDIVAAAYCYGQWHLGSWAGKVYRLGTTPVDASAPLRRTIVSRPLYNDGQLFVVSEVELIGLFGNYDVEEIAPNWITDQNGFPITDQSGRYILAAEQGETSTWKRPGRVWVRVSKDGGHNWGDPKIKDIGKRGQFEARTVFRAMGQYRQFTLEVNMTDPVDVPLLSEANVVAS